MGINNADYTKVKIESLLEKIAKEEGLNAVGVDFIKRAIIAESNGNPNSKSDKDRSTSQGIYGITNLAFRIIVNANRKKFPEIPDTEKLTDDKSTNKYRGDAEVETRVAVLLAKSIDVDLKKVLNRELNCVDYYKGWFAGTPDAKKIIAAEANNPNIMLNTVMSEDSIKKNSPMIINGTLKGGVAMNLDDGSKNGLKLPLKDFTVGDFHDWASAKMKVPPKYDGAARLARYKKGADGLPEATGSMVMAVIALVAVVVAAVATGIGGIFSSDDDDPRPTRTPHTRGRLARSYS